MTDSIRKDYLPFGRPNFSAEEINAVVRVMESGWIGMGAETIAFERELASFVGAPYAIAVNSCTSALFLSLLVHGVGPGDEVICPSLTWCSTANAAHYCGATPVLCDVDLQTFSVTPETIAAALTTKTKAVVVVHYGGLAADIHAIRLAVPAHVIIIEDAAHALGAKYPDGSPVGSSGNLTCFSFYANKNLSTGEGGAIAVTDEDMLSHLQALSRQGLSNDAWKRFTHPQAALVPGIAELGYKMNFMDLLACIGRVQLRRQPEFHSIRHKIASFYLERLAGLPLKFDFQAGLNNSSHALHLFVVSLPVEQMKGTRNEIILALRERNVGASIHYAPLHTMPFFEQTRRTDMPNTNYLGERIMTLPISASMTPEDAEYVVQQLQLVINQ
ncbi:MAG: DegT/DnrJ/EryC1/StrS family aminotransferase [Desulfuromonadaceae bacterium]